MQKKNPKRPVHGILILDKPLNISSNQALQTARRLFQAEKAGHGGSLDRLANGLLPVFFGEATKFSQVLLEANKEYLTTATLGIKTASSDAEGEIIQRCENFSVSLEQLQSVLSEFLGETQQIPSMFSALKFQGKPLYELARQGIEIERAARTISIKKLDLIAYENNLVTLQVQCSKGTYIRNLVEDIGNKLECGAHVSMLRRLNAGPFVEAQMITLDTLQTILDEKGLAGLDDLLLPVDAALVNYPVMKLNEEDTRKISLGQIVTPLTLYQPGVYRTYNVQHKFIGLSEIKEDHRLYAKRMISTNSQ